MTDEEKRIVWDIVENAYNKILKLNSVISEKNAEIEQLKGKIQVDEQVKDVKDKITNLFIDFDVMGFAPTTLCEDTEQYAKDWRRDLVVEIQKLTTIREEPTTKTEQEQLKEIQEIIGDSYEYDSISAELGSGDGYINTEEVAKAIVEAGYGNVSEYKAEIEQLNKKLAKQIRIARDANAKFTGVEHYLRPFQYKADRLQTKCDELKELSDWQRKEIKRLKSEVKQAQIDILNKLRRRAWQGYQIGMYIVSTQEIDELIKEVENAEDKG